MESNNYYNNYFLTSDLGLASSLVTVGYTVESLDRSDPQKIQFIFDRKNNIDDVIQAYWSHELSVSPLAYFNNVKMLKNRIYSS